MPTLKAHGLSAAISPAHGGIVTALDWRHPDGTVQPLLHGLPGAEPGTAEPNRFGLWPLLPFANRAFDGVLRFGDETIALPLNAPDGRSAIHGFGWQSPWAVEDLRDDRLVMTHVREGGAGRGPWAYHAVMTVALTPGAMRVELAVTNRAGRPLPHGIGLHPWFPRTQEARFAASARGALVLGEAYRPSGSGPLPPDVDSLGRWSLPPDAELAASLVDWDGTARLELPERGLAITIRASDTLRHPVLWSPAGADFLCFEPQSHGIGAASEAAVQAVTPLTVLAAGETLSGWMEIAAAAA